MQAVNMSCRSGRKTVLWVKQLDAKFLQKLHSQERSELDFFRYQDFSISQNGISVVCSFLREAEITSLH